MILKRQSISRQVQGSINFNKGPKRANQISNPARKSISQDDKMINHPILITPLIRESSLKHSKETVDRGGDKTDHNCSNYTVNHSAYQDLT